MFKKIIKKGNISKILIKIKNKTISLKLKI